MSYFKIAQDYFNSPKQCKLPQDFKSSYDLQTGFDVHHFTNPIEFLYNTNPAYAPANTLEDLDKPEIIEHYTMFMLFSSIASGETIWNEES